MPQPTTSSSPARVLLSGIDPSAFQHPTDRQTIQQLKKIRGFDLVVAKFLDLGIERIEYVLNIASSLRVTPRQLPKLYGMLQEACSVLDVPMPELYVTQGPVNAYTFGHTNPYIVLYTGLIDSMDDDELMAVIAHEVGHIKCGHVLFKSMGSIMGGLAEFAGNVSFGIGNLITGPIQIGLLAWDRRAELSADRASLLVMQDVRPCINMLMKLAGGTIRMGHQLDTEEFLAQVRSYTEGLDSSSGDRFYRFVAGMYKGTHPFTIERAKELNEWVDSHEFEKILSGTFPRTGIEVTVKHCTKCGKPLGSEDMFCAKCGNPVKA